MLTSRTQLRGPPDSNEQLGQVLVRPCNAFPSAAEVQAGLLAVKKAPSTLHREPRAKLLHSSHPSAGTRLACPRSGWIVGGLSFKFFLASSKGLDVCASVFFSAKVCASAKLKCGLQRRKSVSI